MKTTPTPICIALLVVLAAAHHASAAFVAEYFDNYGTTTLSELNGLNGGTGWGAAWATGGSISPGYAANEQTSFVNANYVGGGESDTNDGRGIIQSGDNAGDIVTRTLATPLTGTVWMSALVRHASNDGGDVLFWFDTNNSGDAVNTFVSLRSGDVPTLRHGGENTTAAELNSAGTNLLFLAKIELDYSGVNDRVSFWIKTESADLSSEAALGAALLSEGDENVFGSSIEFIGLSGGNNISNIDNYRLADGPGALARVLGQAVAVPTPAALPAGLALLTLAAARRRRRA